MLNGLYNTTLNALLYICILFAIVFTFLLLTPSDLEQNPACVKSNGQIFEVKDLRYDKGGVTYTTMNDNQVISLGLEWVMLDDNLICSQKLFD